MTETNKYTILALEKIYDFSTEENCPDFITNDWCGHYGTVYYNSFRNQCLCSCEKPYKGERCRDINYGHLYDLWQAISKKIEERPNFMMFIGLFMIASAVFSVVFGLRKYLKAKRRARESQEAGHNVRQTKSGGPIYGRLSTATNNHMNLTPNGSGNMIGLSNPVGLAREVAKIANSPLASSVNFQEKEKESVV